MIFSCDTSFTDFLLPLSLERFFYHNVNQIVSLKSGLIENAPAIGIVHTANGDRGAARG
jgi:hypothetical protein